MLVGNKRTTLLYRLAFEFAILLCCSSFVTSFAQAQSEDCTTNGTGLCTYIPVGQEQTIVTPFVAFDGSTCKNVINNCSNSNNDALMVPYSVADEWNSFLQSEIATSSNPAVRCVQIASCSPLTVTLTPNPSTVIAGQSLTLSWVVQNKLGGIQCTPSSNDGPGGGNGSWPASGEPVPITNPNSNHTVTPVAPAGGSVTYTLACADSHGNQGSGTALVSVASGSGGGGSTCCPAGGLFGWSLGNNAGGWSCLGDYEDKNPIGGCGGPTYNVISCNNGVYVDSKVCSLDGGLPTTLCASGASSNTCSSGSCPAQNPVWMKNCSGSLAAGSIGDVALVTNAATGYTGQETANVKQMGHGHIQIKAVRLGRVPMGNIGTARLASADALGPGAEVHRPLVVVAIRVHYTNSEPSAHSLRTNAAPCRGEERGARSSWTSAFLTRPSREACLRT